MMDCGCKPGTYENGWQEERSAACLAEELQEWSRMLKAFEDWKARRHD